MADRDSLPFIEALYKEVLRWEPLGPIGIPHRYSADHDDEYNGRRECPSICIVYDNARLGMRIPANSMIIANIWHMLRDPKVYKNPGRFNPARFLGPDSESNPEDVVFGFGRR